MYMYMCRWITLLSSIGSCLALSPELASPLYTLHLEDNLDLGKEVYVSVSRFHDEAEQPGTLGDREGDMERIPDFSASCCTKIREGADDTEDDQREVDESPPQPEDGLDPMNLSQELETKDVSSGTGPPITVRSEKFHQQNEHSTALMLSSFGLLHVGTMTKHSR